MVSTVSSFFVREIAALMDKRWVLEMGFGLYDVSGLIDRVKIWKDWVLVDAREKLSSFHDDNGNCEKMKKIENGIKEKQLCLFHFPFFKI